MIVRPSCPHCDKPLTIVRTRRDKHGDGVTRKLGCRHCGIELPEKIRRDGYSVANGYFIDAADSEDLITPEDICERFDIDHQTLQVWVTTGRIPQPQIGWKREQLAAIVASETSKRIEEVEHGDGDRD